MEFQEYEKPRKEVFNKNNENIDNQEVKANDVLTYKITYKNTSDRELDVTITDELPEHTDYVNGSTVYDDFSNRRLTWRRRVAPEETVEVSFKVRVNQDVDGHILQSSAQVSTDLFTLETNRTSNPTAIKKICPSRNRWEWNHLIPLGWLCHHIGLSSLADCPK